MLLNLIPPLEWLVCSRVPGITILALLTLHALNKLRERKMTEYALLAKIAEVQKERDESIEWARREAGLVSDEDRKRIEGMNFTQLREALQQGTVSVEAVIRTFFGLAALAHERTNCITNVIKVSLDQARELDEKAKDPNYKKPRLFGMPISIKEAVEVEGQRATFGFAKQIDHFAKEDTYQVMKLRHQGMIPFVQTNVPTTCLTYCCSNSIYGTTSSPFNANRTSGGSSGGEGALIGAGGSLIGIGSDIGGSIRIPSAYSGCCGFKPSATRFSTLQLREPIPMRPFCMPTEGPLAQDPHAIAEIMRVLWSDDFISNQDALSVPINFREELFKEGTRYRIGYYTSDGYIDPLPGNQRVILEAVEVLRAQGHTLLPFSLGDIATEAAKGVFGTIFADGGAMMSKKLKDEPLDSLMTPLKRFAAMSIWTRKLIGWISKLRGDSNTADFFLTQSTKAADVQKYIDRLYEGRKRLVQKMKDEEVDVILCPTTISPAVPHSMPNEVPFTAIIATMLWNSLDFPAGVVTTGSWNEEDEEALKAYPEKGLVEARIKRGCKNSIGLPLSVQLVAPPFRDEKVLRVMVDLYDEVKRREQRE